MSGKIKKIMFEDINKQPKVDIFEDDDESEKQISVGKNKSAGQQSPDSRRKERVITDLETSKIIELDEIVAIENSKARQNNNVKIIKRAAIIREMIIKGLESYWKENSRPGEVVVCRS